MSGIVDLVSLFRAIRKNPIVFLTLIVVLSVGIYNLFDLVIIPGKDKEIEELKKENLELKLNLKTLETQNVVKEEAKNVKKEVNSQIQETQQKVLGEVRQIKKKLEQEKENWIAVRFPGSEVVKDVEGFYYVIDIRNAYRNEVINFKTGEYIIDDFDKKFMNSLDKFTSEILRQLLPLNVPHGIFIKGSADILGHDTFKRNFEPLYKFDEIQVYEKVNITVKYRYIRKYKTDYIKEPIRNINLPNLRARFLQKKLFEVYPEIKDAPILDGDVDPRLGGEYRNVTLFLFVKWPVNTDPNAQR